MLRLNRHVSADAGERITPWSVVAGEEHVVCLVNNVSKTTRTVIIEIRDGGGNPVGTDCIAENPLSVSLGAGAVAFHSCNNSSPASRYCHFEVVGTGIAAIRGVMEVRKDGGGGFTRVLLAPAE
jgi:hypothetical protein